MTTNIISISTPKPSTGWWATLKDKFSCISGSTIKVSEISDKSQDIQKVKEIANGIFSEITKPGSIYTNAIQKANESSTWNTRVFVAAVYLGIIAGIIGVGGILAGVSIPGIGCIGIQGIPLEASIGLLSLGAASFFALSALKVASLKNPEGKLGQLYKSFQKARSDWFMDSNLNDFLGILAFAAIGLSFSGLSVGCLQYPFGFLMVFSGLYQLGESRKELLNAKGNTEKTIRQWINIVHSLIIIGLGVTAVLGMMNNPYVIGANFAEGVMACGISLYLYLRYTRKSLEELKEITIDTLPEYLRGKLKLTDQEINTIIFNEKGQKKYNSQKEIADWINDNLESYDEKQKNEWLQKLWNLNRTEKENLQNEIEKIQKEIIDEEIKKTIESKLEDFRALVDGQTFIDTLKAINDNFQNAEELKNLYKIKSQIQVKGYAEIAKCLMSTAFMAVPGVQLAIPNLNKQFYNFSMAALSAVSCFLGLIPRFRNVPPAMEKENLGAIQKITGAAQTAIKSTAAA